MAVGKMGNSFCHGLARLIGGRGHGSQVALADMSANAAILAQEGAHLPKQVDLLSCGKDTKLRIMITGATGNLGREVMKAFRSDFYEVRGLSSKPRQGSFSVCDLTIEGSFQKQVSDFRPHVVLHLAAERKPDVVARDPERAHKLNISAVESISRVCQEFGSWLVFISTDYVFDGTAPPYAVDAVPHPLNDYGKQKAEGEMTVLRTTSMATVLRIPMLYGHVDKLEDSPVTELYAKLQKQALQKADAMQRRYPTYTVDVARVLRGMIDAKQRGGDIAGIFHWQGSECLTKMDMISVMSDITGIDISSVTPDREPPKVPRPEDSRLDCIRTEQLLSGDLSFFRTPFREALKECLRPFASPKL